MPCGAVACMRGLHDGGRRGRAAVSLGAVVGFSVALGGGGALPGVALGSGAATGGALPAVTGTATGTGVTDALGSMTAASDGARNARQATTPVAKRTTTIAAAPSCARIDSGAGPFAVTNFGGAAAGADTVKCGPV